MVLNRAAAPGNMTWAVSSPFVFTVTSDTDNTFALPLVDGGTYNFNVDWGDGTDDDITVWSDTAKDHTYPAASTQYTITITGTITGWAFNGGGDKTLMGNVTSWGPLATGSSAEGMFYGCTNMTIAADAGSINTAGCTSLFNAFRDCSSLTALDVSGFDTAAATSFSHMFHHCSSLTALDVSGFDTAAATNFSHMFNDCPSLTALDVSGFDTAEVKYFAYMFYNCSSLTTAPDVSGWDIEALTYASDFMNVCTPMTTAQYDAVLVAWEAQTEQPNVPVDFGTSTYTDPGAAATARAALVSSGWTITDGGTA